jgi:hypothetical protein
MRKGWVIAAVLGGAAGVAQAAEVQVFGIHTPAQGKWAVYARISNSASVEGGTVSGLSSIGVDVLNQTTGAGSATVQTAFNALPFGTTKYSDPDFFGPPGNVGYGFWLVRSDGEAFTNSSTGESGIRGISGAQNALITPQQPGEPPYANFVLTGVGQTKGVVAADPVGGDKTSGTNWGLPVMVASGSYTPSAVTGAGSQVGLKIRYFGDSLVNVLKVDNPGAGTPWKIEGVAAPTVINAKNFTLGGNLPGDTTVKAGGGDANLDGNVDFNDLVRLAQNYNTSNTNWFEGDFNYDGSTDFNDLVILAQGYNSPVPGEPVGSASFQADMAAAFASVPEPASAGCVVLGVSMLGMRRRRSR